MPVITKCEICGKDVKSSPSRIKKTCSKDCQKIYLSNQKSQGAKSICQQCGKVFSHKPSKSPKFCSKKCKADSQKGPGEYKIDLDMNEIKRLYVEEKLSAEVIARKMGTIKKNILKRLHDMDVDMRSSGESKSIFLKENPDQNPNNMPGVKEKQIQAQVDIFSDEKYKAERIEKLIDGQRNMTPEAKVKWKESKRQQMLNRAPEQVYDQLMKQFETKRKNGTFNCTGIENKYKAILEAKGLVENVDFFREYIIPGGTKRYRYDFYIPSEHLLVEINGTGTHADPEKYLAEDVVKLGIPGWKVRTAKEIWHQDGVKKRYASNKGYYIKTVWERELG